MRFLLIGVGFILILAFINYPGRLYLLQMKSQGLIKESSTFSKDYYVGDSGKPDFTYLALGDSTAVGTGSKSLEGTYPYKIAKDLSEKGRYVHVINKGINGGQYKDVLDSELSGLAELKPDLITVSAGANDVTHHTPFDVYEKNLKELISQIKDYKVLLATTPDLSLAAAWPYPYNNMVQARSQKQNEILWSLELPSNIEIVDFYKSGKLSGKNHPEYYAKDLFHPSGRGYDVWASLFIEKLP